MTEVSANASSGVTADVSTSGTADSGAGTTTSASPAIESTPSVSVASTSIEASTVATAEPAKEATTAESEKTPSLLTADEPVKEPVSAEEIPATDAEKEVSQSDEPAQLPTYEAFALPEDVTVDNERLTDFTKTLAEFESTTKASHEEVQKLGQSLVDRHIAEVRTALTRQMDSVVKQWNDKKTEWVNEFKADPDLGGKRYDTSISEAKEFVRTHGGTPEQINSFYQALKDTGMEAHPAMVRFLLNVKNSSGFKTPQQLTASKPVAQNQSKISKRYGSNA